MLDNIDKGWPATGVDKFDVRLVRLLVEAAEKIKRDFSALGRDFLPIIFLRNDIYELMVNETPDRGKAGQVLIDWTDRAQLRQLVLERLRASTGEHQSDFNRLWLRFFCDTVKNEPSFDYIVNRSLMRPRFLINLVEGSISNAINRGHTVVDEQDVLYAIRQQSLYLVSDFGYEIRDVSGLSEDMLYAFVGMTELLTDGEVQNCLLKAGVSGVQVEAAKKLLFWYGVLGIARNDGQSRFIYDYEYNAKRLDAEIAAADEDRLYVINPALHVALQS